MFYPAIQNLPAEGDRFRQGLRLCLSLSTAEMCRQCRVTFDSMLHRTGVVEGCSHRGAAGEPKFKFHLTKCNG